MMSGSLEAHTCPPSSGRYEITDARDEAFDADGAPRPLYADLLAWLAETDLEQLSGELRSRLAERKVTFRPAVGDDTAFLADPVPRIIEAAEWNRVAAGLAQRARALGRFVADAYGDRDIVAAGVMPVHAIESAEGFEPWMMGVPMNPAGFVSGLDLVRGQDGTLRVLEDNTRTPSGLTYAVAVREALDGCLPAGVPPSRTDPSQGYALLREALRAAAPEGVDDPFVVLLSDGPHNSAWYEHNELARQMDIPIVTRDDVTVRAGRLHTWLGEVGTRPIDVVYRRTDEDTLHDASGRGTWIADLLLAPVRSGRLAVVNPFGAGLADDKLVHAYVEEMVRFYLGEEPLIESVRTLNLGDEEVREEALDDLSNLVLKPRGGLGGQGIVVCRHASEDDRRDVARRVREHPDAWVAQETVTLSTHPTVVGGRLQPRHVDLRPYVVGAGDDAAVVPGGLTRVAYGAGALIVNSSRNGGGKDTWMLS
jgi:uncharacterized circularly permuted ATP-grasp superfamily protein